MVMVPRFLLVLFCLFSLSAAAAEPLTLVCDIWPPYQVHGDQKVSGFSTELIREVCALAGIPITVIHAYPWKRALLMLETDQVDGLFSANHTEERTRFALYPTLPLVKSPWVLWARRDAPHAYAGLQDLRGQRIGVVRGYSYTPAFWEALTQSDSIIEEAPSDEVNFRKLSAGRLDLAVAELHNGRFLLQQEKLENLKPFPLHPIKTDGLYLIFNKNRVPQETVDRFSESLRAFKDSEAYQVLYNHYFRENLLTLPPSPEG
jgi:polar amino acid transport system substrate-binding protein